MAKNNRAKPEKTISGILSILLAVCLFLIALMTSVEAASFNETFYRREYKELDTADSVGTSEQDLMSVTRELLSYLKGGRPNLDGIYITTADGNVREFFNDREKAHMIDVQKLFAGGYTLRTVLIIISAGLIAAILLISRRKALYRIADGIFRTGIVLLVLFGAVLIYAAVDFNGMFTAFHKTFFSNDLWLLNPATDLLIRLVPLQFFTDVAVRIALYFGAAFALLMTLAAIVRYESAYAPWKKVPKRRILSGLRPASYAIPAVPASVANDGTVVEVISDGGSTARQEAVPDNHIKAAPEAAPAQEPIVVPEAAPAQEPIVVPEAPVQEPIVVPEAPIQEPIVVPEAAPAEEIGSADIQGTETNEFARAFEDAISDIGGHTAAMSDDGAPNGKEGE